MNERIIELVHGELDGTNTAEERSELKKLLETDESAKAYFDETETFFGTLDSVSEVEPPPGLKERIMASIDVRPATAALPSKGLFESLKELFEPVLRRPAWAVSYAFAAGLIVGIAALLVINPVSPPPEVVRGTIGQPPSTVIDQARLEVGELTVELKTSDIESESILDVRIAGSGEATIRIESGVDQQPTTISAPGPGHFTIGLDMPGEINVRVASAGQEAETSLVVAGTSTPVEEN